ncbi:type II toxin-antitoxin system HicB family antitoxin [Candidatus Binatus sp.]|uniref:type II toxin-antitoxin system HicB family antitoxin n=1 Tax=Candidatus Binatus sp. TaxID=2811406 RepID=UPI003BBC514E
MERTFTAYVEFDPDAKLYVGTIPGLSGAHSQGATLDELRENLREVIELVIEEKAARGEPLEVEPFVGIQQIVVGA